MAPEIVVDTQEALASLLARRFEACVREAVRTRGHFACALPGGSVARAFSPAPARLALPWPPRAVFSAAERAPAPSDPYSTLGLAPLLWRRAVRVPAPPTL